LALLAATPTALTQFAVAQEANLKGRILDPHGRALPQASVALLEPNDSAAVHPQAVTTSGVDGLFLLKAPRAGQFNVRVEATGFRPVTQPVIVENPANVKGEARVIEIRMNEVAPASESVMVTADVNDVDILSPDPALRVFVTQDLLDANPGRPGAPVSIPGYPIETASSGIKAPQYFAPGVAGDHGEPIAQYIAVGGYLVPNNLSANAHGNGYADPNIFIPQILESVQVDGGAFNVREGNHSVNLAATYTTRSRLSSFLTLTADYRDLDLVGGFSPKPNSFFALEASYGNGFLNRLEHRQQYKFNGQRLFRTSEHRLTLFGIGYYGSSYVPGLVPIFAPNAYDMDFTNSGDTIDARQKDQTHTALVAANDAWQISQSQQLEFSGFFRTYNLALYSNFGQGLIRQSEFRTVAGGTANYVNRVGEALSILAGFDTEREAPRRDNLDKYEAVPFPIPSAPGIYGPFTKVASNNVTIGSLTPYIAAQGVLARHFRYYLGWRHDEIDVDNDDLLHAQNSFQKWVGVNSPKATLAFLPGQSHYLPLVSLSFGEAFFTDDPRIGTGTVPGSPVSTARSYQLVTSKTIHGLDFKLTLGHVTTSQTLAKLDPDTGLQYDEGPGRLRFLTVAVRRNFRRGSLLATFSKADARDLATGQPTPEAPRTIFDLLGTMQKLPWRLELRGEFEYVATKPLGIGCDPANPDAECTGVAVKEFRAAVARPFLNGRFDAGLNMLVASGYTGQTTENFVAQTVQEVVGVRIPSYASLALTYRFGR
jgi:Carboxypeptidase regulatory-like domain